jgi:hypothetical protein
MTRGTSCLTTRVPVGDRRAAGCVVGQVRQQRGWGVAPCWLRWRGRCNGGTMQQGVGRPWWTGRALWCRGPRFHLHPTPPAYLPLRPPQHTSEPTASGGPGAGGRVPSHAATPPPPWWSRPWVRPLRRLPAAPCCKSLQWRRWLGRRRQRRAPRTSRSGSGGRRGPGGRRGLSGGCRRHRRPQVHRAGGDQAEHAVPRCHQPVHATQAWHLHNAGALQHSPPRQPCARGEGRGGRGDAAGNQWRLATCGRGATHPPARWRPAASCRSPPRRPPTPPGSWVAGRRCASPASRSCSCCAAPAPLGGARNRGLGCGGGGLGWWLRTSTARVSAGSLCFFRMGTMGSRRA